MKPTAKAEIETGKWRELRYIDPLTFDGTFPESFTVDPSGLASFSHDLEKKEGGKINIILDIPITVI